LLKLVSGLETGHTGRIVFGGQDMSAMPVHQRRMGMVFQNYALFPHLSVLDNVAYGLKLRKVAVAERHRRARELLDIVGLAGYAQRGLAQLSGGQQQRVALARALAIDPQALLLDEPLSALDASVRGHLRDEIRAIQQRFGATTLLVTHDQEEALVMADRVAMLKDGRLLQIATPRELYEQPASRAVAEFVGLSTILPGKVSAPGRVDLGFAELIAHTGARAVGTALHAMVRPEHVRPDPAPGSVNRLEGRTGAQRYLGALTRYDFAVPGAGKPFLAESALPAAEAIAIAPEHIRLLDL
jgi:putative spermidine/putrescine transport system ATP-binding protein